MQKKGLSEIDARKTAEGERCQGGVKAAAAGARVAVEQERVAVEQERLADGGWRNRRSSRKPGRVGETAGRW